MLSLLLKTLAAWLVILVASAIGQGIVALLLRVKIKGLVVGIGSPIFSAGWLTLRPIPTGTSLNVEAATLRSEGGSVAWKMQVLLIVPSIAVFACAYALIGATAGQIFLSTISQFFTGAFSPLKDAQDLLNSFAIAEKQATISYFVGLVAAKAAGIFGLSLLAYAGGRTISRFQHTDPDNVHQLLTLFSFAYVALWLSWLLALLVFLLR